LKTARSTTSHPSHRDDERDDDEGIASKQPTRLFLRTYHCQTDERDDERDDDDVQTFKLRPGWVEVRGGSRPEVLVRPRGDGEKEYDEREKIVVGGVIHAQCVGGDSRW